MKFRLVFFALISSLVAFSECHSSGRRQGHAGNTPSASARTSGHITALAVGTAHSCVLTEQGSVLCWGLPLAPSGYQAFNPVLPELFDSTTPTSNVQLLRRFPRLPHTVFEHARNLFGTRTEICAASADGGQRCLTGYWDISVDVPTDWWQRASRVASTGWDLCAVSQHGLQCVGVSEYFSARTLAWVPTMLARSSHEYCVLKSTGELFCGAGNQRSFSRASCTHELVDQRRVQDSMMRAIVESSPVARDVAEVVSTEERIYFRTRSGSVFQRHHLPTPLESAISLPGISRKLSAGSNHVCSLQDDARAYCWGENSSGQLGNGTFEAAAEPTPVVGLESAQILETGANHTCAVTTDSKVYCWGAPTLGRLGTDAHLFSMRPRLVALPAPVRSAGAGWAHTCALLQNDEVYCWGRGSDGELALRELAFPRECDEALMSLGRAIPRRVGTFSGATQLLVSGRFSCVLSRAETQCWGYQLETGLPASSPTRSPSISAQILAEPTGVLPAEIQRWSQRASSDQPTQTHGLTFPPLERNMNCRITPEGRVECMCKLNPSWADGLEGDSCLGDGYHPIPLPSVAAGVAVGHAHACAWLQAGALYCWGANEFSQLSQPSSLDSRVPHEVLLDSVVNP